MAFRPPVRELFDVLDACDSITLPGAQTPAQPTTRGATRQPSTLHVLSLGLSSKTVFTSNLFMNLLKINEWLNPRFGAEGLGHSLAKAVSVVYVRGMRGVTAEPNPLNPGP